MPSEQDRNIFVTGVVGRAMGSGQFKKEDIQTLTDNAFQAFNNTFGTPGVVEAPATPPTVPFSMPSPSLPEGKPFEMWKKDKCSHWNATMRDATWEWLHNTAKGPSGFQALTALKEMSVNDPGDPGAKWYKANVRRASRAKTVLAMVSSSSGAG